MEEDAAIIESPGVDKARGTRQLVQKGRCGEGKQ